MSKKFEKNFISNEKIIISFLFSKDIYNLYFFL
jgi:hypothetical protein